MAFTLPGVDEWPRYRELLILQGFPSRDWRLLAAVFRGVEELRPELAEVAKAGESLSARELRDEVWGVSEAITPAEEALEKFLGPDRPIPRLRPSRIFNRSGIELSAIPSSILGTPSGHNAPESQEETPE
jgi:hypothetical protein